METAYKFMETDSMPNADELTLWIYLQIRSVPNNVFRFNEYARDLVGKFRALPETHLPIAFVLFCKTMCTRLTVDEHNSTINYDILVAILNITSDTLRLPFGEQIYMDTNFPRILSEYLNRIVAQHNGRNALLVLDLAGEIRMCAAEYAAEKRHFITTIRDDLMKKAWHPSRVLRCMEMGQNPEDM